MFLSRICSLVIVRPLSVTPNIFTIPLKVGIFTIRPLFAFSFVVIIAYGFSPLNPIVLILFALVTYFGILYVLKAFSKVEFNLFERALDEGRDRLAVR